MKFYTDSQQFGKSILHTYIEDGIRHRERIDYSPSLYAITNKETEFKTIYGENLAKLDFTDIYEANDHRKEYKDVGNYKLYGNSKWANSFIATTYTDDSVDYNFEDVSISFIDIETTSEYGNVNIFDTPEEINLITILNKKHKPITFGTKSYSGKFKDNYQFCQDEKSLLKRFLEYWIHHCPDVLSSWNGDTFDIPYIVRRMDKMLGNEYTKQLSPWKVVREKNSIVNNKEVITYDIYGIQQLDYLALYKKFRLIPRENYRLDTIAECEINANKLKNPAKTFKQFYTDHWEQFVDYNIHDVQLIVDLEAKLKLLEVALTMAYTGHVNYSDVFSPVALWESIINSYLLNQNIITPLEGEGYSAEAFEGAYVKEPIKGLKGWTCSFDAASLYPSIIMQWNISPETLYEDRQNINIERLLNKEYTTIQGYTLAANGTQYSKEKQGFLPALMRKFFNSRVIYKKRMLDAKKKLECTTISPEEKFNLEKISTANRNLEQAVKISINAAYGALGNQFFKYYDVRLAEAITLTGQFVIKWGNKAFNNYYINKLKLPEDDYVTYCDTDSLYVNVQPIVDKFFKDKTENELVDIVDKICKTKFNDLLQETYKELFEYTNAFESTINFKREAICSRGFWTAKKKYVVRVHDNEGVRYSTPENKVTGLQIIQSSTPAMVKKTLRQCVDVILSGSVEDLRTHVEKVKLDFFAAPAEDIASPRGVNDVDKYTCTEIKLYNSGTPIAVRGAILHNYYVKNLKLEQQYARIQNGDKIKYVYLKKQNPIRENIMSFTEDFPEEIVARQYVDYQMQWDKVFMAALNIMLKSIDWELEPKLTLDEWFC
ncbi:MAG: DNA polymerase domain-containing protein [Bacilli bacterium]|nr:DNA polymerase domain-containing protein [Bacilli bacterium]